MHQNIAFPEIKLKFFWGESTAPTKPQARFYVGAGGNYLKPRPCPQIF